MKIEEQRHRRGGMSLFRKKRLVTVSANKKYLNFLNVCCVPSARCHYLLLPGVNPQQWRPWTKLKMCWPHGSSSGPHGTWDLKEGTSHKAWLQVRTEALMRGCWLKHDLLGNSEHIFQHLSNMRAITPILLSQPSSIWKVWNSLCVYLLTNIYCSYSAAYFQKEFWNTSFS